jgi:hypothetical protein
MRRSIFAADRHLRRSDDAQTHLVAFNSHHLDGHILVAQLDGGSRVELQWVQVAILPAFFRVF